MKFLKKISIVILVFVICFSNSKIILACNENLYKKVIEISKGNIVESGITTKFHDFNESMPKVEEILKKMNLYTEDISTNYKYEEGYVEFKGKQVQGFLNKNFSNNIITLQIIVLSEENSIEALKDNLMNIINNKLDSITFFEYIKCKLPEETNLDKLQEEIFDFFEREKAEVNHIEIKNGHSSMVNFKDSHKDNINYALSKYSSGKYFILGTPEIIIPY